MHMLHGKSISRISLINCGYAIEYYILEELKLVEGQTFCNLLSFQILQDVSESSSDSDSNSSSSSGSDSDSDSEVEQETVTKKTNGHGKY